MDIAQILKDSEKGNLEFCRECPWSPKHEQLVGFGVSCTDHGMNWKTENKANSMLVVQDPGDTTPHDTGRLCVVHNAKNPSDKTAQQNLQLWNAAVSLEYNKPEAGGYMKEHYWTNATMHGAPDSTGLREKNIMKTARECCSNILALQIVALKPNVLIASGEKAVNSLYEIDILKNNWSKIRHHYSKGAYREDISSWRGLPKFAVFCTYHTAARVVNQTLSDSYSRSPLEIENYIKEKAGKLISQDSINLFLSKYNNPGSNRTSKGMRFLLNHWLDIGMEIRLRLNEQI